MSQIYRNSQQIEFQRTSLLCYDDEIARISQSKI